MNEISATIQGPQRSILEHRIFAPILKDDPSELDGRPFQDDRGQWYVRKRGTIRKCEPPVTRE